jgi:hypothetical protein
MVAATSDVRPLKRRWVVGLVGLALVLIAAVWCLTRPERLDRLPDGTSISVSAVTFGTNHIQTWGSPWRTQLRQHLPRAVARGVNLPILGNVMTPTNAMVVWFRVGLATNASGRFVIIGSRYECTLATADRGATAADTLTEVVCPILYNDSRRLCYAVFPRTDLPFVVRVQERVVDSEGKIQFTHPPPAGAGLSGARLISAGALEFRVPPHPVR